MNILLIQWRLDKVVADHERDCFMRHAGWDPSKVKSFDACKQVPTLELLENIDALVVGGSGDFLVSQGDMPLQMDGMFKMLKEARHRNLPILGICFGSQIMTKAFGGKVVMDSEREEAGTFMVKKLAESAYCPIMQGMPTSFMTQLGHKDHLEYLPFGAINLASSEKSQNQCWTFEGEPVYAMLWHPELLEEDMQYRVRFYAKVYGWNEEKIQEIFTLLMPSPRSPDALRGFFEEVVKKGRVYGGKQG